MRSVSLHRRVAAALMECLLRWSSTQTGLALVYHELRDEPRPYGDVFPSVSSRQFEAHLRHLSRRYRVVLAGDLHQAIADRRRGEPLPVAITFDDDLRSHVDIALPRLGAVGLRATFFLCGASLDAPFAFWWERLQHMVDQEGAAATEHDDSRTTVAHARSMASHIDAMSPAEQRLAANELSAVVGQDSADSGLRTVHVRAIAAAGHEIGFHTLGHYRLTRLTDDELDEALTLRRSDLASAADQPLRAIAYPHGDVDTRVVRAAEAAGFSSGFTTAWAAVDPATDPLLMGRLDPTGWPPGRFGYLISRTMWNMRKESRKERHARSARYERSHSSASHRHASGT